MLQTSGLDAHAEARRLSRRTFLCTGGAAALAFAAYAGTHARHELEVTHLKIAIRELPDAFEGFQMVQISDIHLLEYTEPWFLERVVDKVNALHAELVVFTGDLISDGPGPYSIAYRGAGKGAEILQGLKANQRFAIMGNHDAKVGEQRIADTLQAHGTPVLQDSYAAIERGGDRFWLCGTKDITWNRPDLDRTLPSDSKAPVILLAHEPDYADYVASHPRGQAVDLMLSGHSHGGQIRLPVLGPVVLPMLGRKYVRGSYQLGKMQLYVNSGIGSVALPIRLNCPPEITHIELVRN